MNSFMRQLVKNLFYGLIGGALGLLAYAMVNAKYSQK